MNIFQWLGTILKKPDRYSELKQFGLFSQLNAYELFQISNIITERSFKAGEIIYEQGFPVEAIFLIQKGEVQLKGSNQPGGIRVLGQYQIIGLIDMFNAGTRSCSAHTVSPTSVLAISRTDLSDLIAGNPRLGNKILSSSCELLANRISELNSPV